MSSDYSVSINGGVCLSPTGLHRSINLGGEEATVVFNHRWAKRASRTLDEIDLDFLTVVEGCHAIDKACRRRGDDPSGWNRRIDVGIAVRQPERWQTFAGRLQEVFGDLTSDSLRVNFSKDESPSSSPRQSSESFPTIDSVALLSGGVDSLVGGGVLLQEGRNVGFMSHSAGSAVSQAQQQVGTALNGLGPGKGTFSDFTITLKRKSAAPFPTESETEPSERARTLLFIGVAMVMARTCSVEEVFVSENGIMAVHVPIAEARLGSYSTKTAAPSVLEAIQEFGSVALETDFRITNPLVTSTKAEVVQRGIEMGLADALRSSVSCWSINRHAHGHCGTCVPCITRRFAFSAADAGDTNYLFDIFSEELKGSDKRFDNLIHYLSYARDLVALNDAELEMTYGEILEDSASLSPEASLAMHRRWGSQVEGIVATHPPLMNLWGLS